MVEEFNVDWKAECGQFNLAHVARNKKVFKKRGNKTKPVHGAHLVRYRLKIREGSPKRTRKTGGKDFWKTWVLSMGWKAEGVIDGESEGDDCDEVICTGWGEPGRRWTEWGWRNGEGSWFHSWLLEVTPVWKTDWWLVMRKIMIIRWLLEDTADI